MCVRVLSCVRVCACVCARVRACVCVRARSCASGLCACALCVSCSLDHCAQCVFLYDRRVLACAHVYERVCVSSEPLGIDASFVLAQGARRLFEARILNRLVHPNVLRVHEVMFSKDQKRVRGLLLLWLR